MTDNIVGNAISLAHRAHQGQWYGRDDQRLPFIVHPTHVAGVLQRFGLDTPDRLAAAWLHDVLEDTTITYDEIAFATFQTVANLVLLVTDGKEGNRKARHKVVYDRLASWGNRREREDAVIVKLADRIANVEASVLMGSKLLDMYRKEYVEFVQNVLVWLPVGDEKAYTALKWLDALIDP